MAKRDASADRVWETLAKKTTAELIEIIVDFAMLNQASMRRLEKKFGNRNSPERVDIRD